MAPLRSGGEFRDARAAIARYAAELRRERERELEVELSAEWESLWSARRARIHASIVACCTMVALFLTAMAEVAVVGLRNTEISHLAALLFFGWGASALTWAALALTGRRTFRRLLAGAFSFSGDSARDLEMLRNRRARDVAREMVDDLETAAVAWPLAAAAMTLPLILHFLIFEISSGLQADPGEFGGWVLCSALLVTHCHIVLARRLYRYGADIARGLPGDDFGLAAIGVAMATSLIPGALLFGVSTVLVGLTGIVIVPAALWDARKLVARERRARTRATLASEPRPAASEPRPEVFEPRPEVFELRPEVSEPRPFAV